MSDLISAQFSTRYRSFMTALFLTHILMFAVLFMKPEYFSVCAQFGYGFLGTFGFVTGLSKTAEKWRKPDA